MIMHTTLGLKIYLHQYLDARVLLQNHCMFLRYHQLHSNSRMNKTHQILKELIADESNALRIKKRSCQHDHSELETY